MQLEGSDVFRGGAVERFLDEVEEVANVVGVSINGCVGHVANLKVFGKPFYDLASSFFVRRHVVDPGVFLKRTKTPEWLRKTKAQVLLIKTFVTSGLWE